MKRGDIWVVSLEPRKGAEVGKQRPALVVQTDLLNDVGHPTVIIAPISSRAQAESVLRFKIEHPALHKNVGYVLIDQVRAIDAALRARRRIGKISPADMNAIGALLMDVLDLGSG